MAALHQIGGTVTPVIVEAPIFCRGGTLLLTVVRTPSKVFEVDWAGRRAHEEPVLGS